MIPCEWMSEWEWIAINPFPTVPSVKEKWPTPLALSCSRCFFTFSSNSFGDSSLFVRRVVDI